MADAAPKAEKKSVARQIIEQAETRLAEVREQIAPLQKEEAELIEVVPSERRKQEPAPPKPAPGRRPGRPAGSGNGSKPKQKRRRRGGTRGEQAIAFIKDNPGANASEVAVALGVKVNYLYRVLGDLVKEGQVKKDGLAYTAVE